MAESPVHKYCCKVLDLYDEQSREVGHDCLPEVACLVQRIPIRHSVMNALTTDGQILSRSRRGGQFCKYCSGGGSGDKSLAHSHFASRNGVYADLGIDFDNEAVLDISPPILAIEAPHSDAQAR